MLWILETLLEKKRNISIENGIKLLQKSASLAFVFGLMQKPSLGWRDMLAKDVLTSWLENEFAGKGIAQPLLILHHRHIPFQDTGSYLIFLKVLTFQVEMMIRPQLHETLCCVEMWILMAQESQCHSHLLHNHLIFRPEKRKDNFQMKTYMTFTLMWGKTWSEHTCCDYIYCMTCDVCQPGTPGHSKNQSMEDIGLEQKVCDHNFIISRLR